MEIIDYSNIYTNIFLLLIFIVSIYSIAKWVAGDFKPTSIECFDTKTLEIKDINNMVVKKQVIYTYKYTYNDGSVKFKIKKFKV